MINKPLLTVVIMCFNKAKYIKNAINSVVNQSYKNYEFIIWDAGSKDGSREIIKEYSNNDIKIIFANENFGVSADKNRALLISKGEYIIFFDADDNWEKNILEKLVSLINLYPYCGGYSSAYIINTKKKVSHMYFPNFKRLNFKLNYYFLARLSGWGIHTSSIVIKKDFLIKIGGYPFCIYSSTDQLHIMTNLNSEIIFKTNSNFSNINSKLESFENLSDIFINYKFNYNYKKLKIYLPGGHGEDQYVHDLIAYKYGIATHNNCIAYWNSNVPSQLSNTLRQNLLCALNGARLIEEKNFIQGKFFSKIILGLYKQYLLNGMLNQRIKNLEELKLILSQSSKNYYFNNKDSSNNNFIFQKNISLVKSLTFKALFYPLKLIYKLSLIYLNNLRSSDNK